MPFWTKRWAGPLVIASLAIVSLGLFAIHVPDYLRERGFPLDDAWIHAVYGRSIARHFAFEYNPGVAASGETSPLWALLLALPHLMLEKTPAVVLGIKLLGFCFHLLTAVACRAALDVGDDRESKTIAFAGALLVAMQPDLVAASMSGMEVPLATLSACLLLLHARKPRVSRMAVVTAMAILSRPELGVVAFLLPLLIHGWRERRPLGRGIVGAALGATIAGVIIMTIAIEGSDRLLPATFHAKVAAPPSWSGQWLGFTGLLPLLAPFHFWPLIPLGGVLAIRMLIADRLPRERVVAAAFVAALGFCALSFALIYPGDPEAFYHQRYILPVLPLLLAFLPAAVARLVRWRFPDRAITGAGGMTGVVLLVLLIAAPARYRHLANDAHNIDDVQVEMGKFLANAPVSENVWAVDAGAVRYFGSAFVVDMVGLNSPEMLSSVSSRYLSAHRPHFLDVFGSWSELRWLDGAPTVTFHVTTPYTVTSDHSMGAHELVQCPPGGSFEYRVRQRIVRGRCP
jgi:hypothetical protein